MVCLSGLILAAFESMKATTRLIRLHVADLGYRPPIVLGGGTVDSDICDFAGADSWSTDAMEGVRICQELIGREERGWFRLDRSGTGASPTYTERGMPCHSCGSTGLAL